MSKVVTKMNVVALNRKMATDQGQAETTLIFLFFVFARTHPSDGTRQLLSPAKSGNDHRHGIFQPVTLLTLSN